MQQRRAYAKAWKEWREGWREGRREGRREGWKKQNGNQGEERGWTQGTTMGASMCCASDGALLNELLPVVYCSQRGAQCAGSREDCCWRADISFQPDTHILIPLRIFYSSACPYFCLAALLSASYIRRTGILFTARLAEQSPAANKFVL